MQRFPSGASEACRGLTGGLSVDCFSLCSRLTRSFSFLRPKTKCLLLQSGLKADGKRHSTGWNPKHRNLKTQSFEEGGRIEMAIRLVRLHDFYACMYLYIYLSISMSIRLSA